MKTGSGPLRPRRASAAPSVPRPLPQCRAARHAGILGEVSAGQAGIAAALCPRRCGGGGLCLRAVAPAEAARQRLPRVLSRHLGRPRAAGPTATTSARPPQWFGCPPPPRPSAVVQSGPAAAPAPPDGSDAARRPVLPACRQWRPGRRSPGRRSLPPPPGRAPRRPVSAGGGRWRWGSWWGGLCRVVPRWRGAGGARRAPPPPAGPASLSGQAAGSRAARRVLGRDESGVRDAVPLLCDFGAV